jgi:hypothetical protein
LAAQKYTGTQIAKILNDENVPTPQQRQTNAGHRRRWTYNEKQFWYSSIVTKLLNDERYTGKQIFGKARVVEVATNKRKAMPKEDWLIIPGTIPALITEEQYNAVRKLVSGRLISKYEHKESKLLFSKKLKCGHCGIALRVVRRKDEIKYKCSTLNMETGFGCKDEFIFEKDLADAVLAAIHQQIALADEARIKLKAKAEQLAPSIEKLRGEVLRHQKLIDKSHTVKVGLWEKYHDGEISAERFQRENEKADEQAAKSTAKIPGLKARIREFERETGCENVFVERYCKQAGIQELTRAVVVEFISEIKVYAGGRIEIIFNYADEYAKLAALFDGGKKKRGA